MKSNLTFFWFFLCPSQKQFSERNMQIYKKYWFKKNENFAAQPNLIKTYMIGSNVSNSENRKKG